MRAFLIALFCFGCAIAFSSDVAEHHLMLLLGNIWLAALYARGK